MIGAGASIDRASAADTTSLATDLDAAPMHVGAVVLLDGGRRFDVDAAMASIGDRICSVPRLRQVLRPTPLGCGRPVWVDAPDFAVGDHLGRTACPDGGSEAGLLRLAADLLGRPMPRSRPLWSATFVTGLAGDRTALVVAFHHVLADGIGGLAVLAALVDGADLAGATVTAGPTVAGGPTVAAGPSPGDAPDPVDDPGLTHRVDPGPPVQPPGFPRPGPSTAALLLDALGERSRQLRGVVAAARRTWAAVADLRSRRTGRAPASSLNRPTGPRRRLAVVHAPLEPLHASARSHGATVNDVLLDAIGTSLHALLEQRGERVERFVVTVPITRRPSGDAEHLGNQVDLATIEVPATGPHGTRLAAIHAAARRAKDRPPTGATDLLGPMFRLLARLHLFRWCIDRQRFVNTFVTNLRGPDAEVRLQGAPVVDIVPLSVATGNVTVSFAALSYAGTLTVTVIADPETCPDLDVLAAQLQDRLAPSSCGLAPEGDEVP